MHPRLELPVSQIPPLLMHHRLELPVSRIPHLLMHPRLELPVSQIPPLLMHPRLELPVSQIPHLLMLHRLELPVSQIPHLLMHHRLELPVSQIPHLPMHPLPPRAFPTKVLHMHLPGNHLVQWHQPPLWSMILLLLRCQMQITKSLKAIPRLPNLSRNLRLLRHLISA